ncbi:DsbA family protein [Micromonospora sp. WMMD1082]|uniref:DsbA family oxidoreductase n=1 Tax=Micromonospora sp. WMMD1082 TaxID=3016104 RepID=UPI0024172A1D|nr:DsbA family protein [Micromonospora sp. WMMD1082]MDG4795656.1 DsbA family protein [Micromonospora sp. WMMD1082]
MRTQVFVDIICPWCYIGLRRLEQTLAQLPTGHRVEIEWRSYELGQTNTEPGPTAAEALATMWGERATERLHQITDLGAQVGLDLRLDLATMDSLFELSSMPATATRSPRPSPTRWVRPAAPVSCSGCTLCP